MKLVNLEVKKELIDELLIHAGMLAEPSETAGILIEMYKKRQIEIAIQKLDDESVDTFIEEINNINNSIENSNFDDCFTPVDTCYDNYVLEKQENKQNFRLQLKPFATFGEGGLRIPKSGLIVLAARAKVGKTTLALQLAKALSYETKVAFFSLEMTTNSIMNKYLALPTQTTGGVNPKILGNSEIKKNMLLPQQNEHIDKASSEFLQDNVRFMHNRMTVDDIINQMRAGKKRGFEVFVIDQLSKIFHDNYRMTTKQKYDEIVDKLSRFCKQEKILIILLSQCNRQVDGREDKMPKDSDISDTDRLLQEADILIAGAWKEPAVCANWLVVERNGEGGRAEIQWDKTKAMYKI